MIAAITAIWAFSTRFSTRDRSREGAPPDRISRGRRRISPLAPSSVRGDGERPGGSPGGSLQRERLSPEQHSDSRSAGEFEFGSGGVFEAVEQPEWRPRAPRAGFRRRRSRGHDPEALDERESAVMNADAHDASQSPGDSSESAASSESSALEGGDLRPDQLRALVERAQKGDRQAFTVLLERHRGVAIAKAYGTLGDMDLSYDALQEAFLKTWQKLNTLGQPERFSGWFLMIVKNASLDVARRRSRVSGREQGWEELPGEDRSLPRPAQGAESLAQGERAKRIRAAIQSLPAEYREVLLLKHEEGRSYREIARLLRTTVKAVESRLFRARQQLSRAVENEGRSDGDSRR